VGFNLGLSQTWIYFVCLVDMVEPDRVFNSLELIGTHGAMLTICSRTLDGRGDCRCKWSDLEWLTWCTINDNSGGDEEVWHGWHPELGGVVGC